jgi:PhoH-like ATPase
MVKAYILDTNILLDSPRAIFGFDDNTVIITGTTLQELDSKKTAPGELGFNARETCRIIEKLRLKGDLTAGVPMDNAGVFKVILNAGQWHMPSGYSEDKPDNQIINTVLDIKKNQGHMFNQVILVTNDTSMRINASVCAAACGFSDFVESYRNDHVSSAEMYTGKRELHVSKEAIDYIYKNKMLPPEAIFRGDIPEPVENEFFILQSDQSSALAVYRNHELKLIDTKTLHPCHVQPKNASQTFALWALMQPVEEIPFVILKGPAGTAKTFLSLAAGLDQAYDLRAHRSYDSVLISRNNVMADADFGYLPGELEDKMNPLLAPFFDNLESLLRGNSDEDRECISRQIEDMIDSGVIEICALAYMRGRSITNKFLIVDETQNATRSQIRDIITRAGSGCKIVICGDPEQIDAHNLDKLNNGLVFASEKMKGSPVCAQISFTEEESVRSELAKEAIKRLTL